MLKSFSGFLSFLIIFSMMSGEVRGATISVNNTSDSYDQGNCSLRDAIQSMNNQSDFGGCVADGPYQAPEGDTILLADATYHLSVKGSGEDQNASGDFDIYNNSGFLTLNINIQGVAGGNTTLDAADLAADPNPDPDRILEIFETIASGFNSNVSVNISDVVFTNGGSPTNPPAGGAIFNVEGNLFLQRVLVTGNYGNPGGGIYNVGLLTLEESVITDNETPNSAGGGLFNVGAATLQLVDISNNRAPIGPGGGIMSPAGLLWMNQTTVDSNLGTFVGGGVYSGSLMAITNSTLSRNEVVPGPAVANSSEFYAQGNTDGLGGGIFINAPIFIVNSTISNNTAPRAGGGIFSTPFRGGGAGEEVSGEGSPFLELYNVTIADNTVTDVGGFGGGICQDCVAIIPNSVDSAGILSIWYNTLVADNSAANDPDCSGDFTSGGFNLIGNSSGCLGFGPGTQDQLDVPADIGPLQNNGGPTETHGLLATSTAIDRGNNVEGCQAPTIDNVVDGPGALTTLTQDQRAFLRPVAVIDPNDPRCDIGAFEFQTFDFEVTKDDGLGDSTVAVGEEFTYTITVTNNGPGEAADITLNDPLPDGVSFVSVNTDQGTCQGAGNTLTCDLGDFPAGTTATIQIVVLAEQEGDYTNVVTVSTHIKEFQTDLEKTAQDDTRIQGNIYIFGSGCSLEKEGRPIPAWVWVFGMLGLLIPLELRRRARAS